MINSMLFSPTLIVDLLVHECFFASLLVTVLALFACGVFINHTDNSGLKTAVSLVMVLLLVLLYSLVSTKTSEVEDRTVPEDAVTAYDFSFEYY